MATDQKYQQSYPLAPSNFMPRSDAESLANFRSNNIKKENKIRNILFFTMFVAGIVLLFSLIFVRIKSPQIWLENIRVSNNGDGNINFAAQVFVRNSNYWRYEFDSTLGTITSGGETVGQFIIPEAEVRRRSTKKLYINANIVTPARQGVSNTNGILPVTSQAMLRGKLQIFRVFRRKKSADLSCTMNINLTISAIQDLDCK
ncbi:PREDICTED: uncharacterized protein LOC109216166 [Nicotiana attenuata]|uniref:Late embryogenesis abundant protein LEA-2 subgroup domain-containing protein n=1 Tax=Nicotiana attenuata TaxID=49451 RepID=A0A1J6K3W4_NICAT|nr:PREDICTED: uncharacterized protein LOC109216166 [Nicotiana attenuata]OIT24730.1 hypothetical protein A4A49_36111 [Nicotiana attenuata]